MTGPADALPAPEEVQEKAGLTQFQRVRKHGAMYTVGSLVQRATSVAMLPVYTRYLSPADYGILQLIELTFDVITMVAGARLSAGVFYFFHKARDVDERRKLLTTTLVLMVLSYGVVAAVAFALAPAISALVFRTRDYTDLVRIGALSVGFQSLTLVPLAYLQAREWSGRYVFATTGKLALQLIVNVVTLVWLGMGPKGMLISSMIGNALMGAWLTALMLNDLGFSVSPSAARAVLRFSVPLVTMQVATFASTYGDRYFIQRAFPRAADGDAAVGTYGLAYQFGFLLNHIGFAPFFNVWEPMRFEIAKRADRDRLYARGFIYLNILYLTVATAMGLAIFDFLRIMTTPAFLGAATIVPVILLAYTLQTWTDFQNVGIMITERTGLLSLANWIAAAVAIGAYALLIPRYHGMGAAVATVVSFAVRYALVLGISQRLWPVRYEWTPVVKLFLLASSVVILGMLLPPLAILASIAARLGLFALYCLLVLTTGVMSKTDAAFVGGFLRSPSTMIGGLRNAVRGIGN